jgi:hypothetical protein
LSAIIAVEWILHCGFAVGTVGADGRFEGAGLDAMFASVRAVSMLDSVLTVTGHENGFVGLRSNTIGPGEIETVGDEL